MASNSLSDLDDVNFNDLFANVDTLPYFLASRQDTTNVTNKKVSGLTINIIK